MNHTQAVGIVLTLMVVFGWIVPGMVGASVVTHNGDNIRDKTETRSLIQTGTEAAEIVVQPGESIQNAVDQAAEGDTIEVKSGTYEQSVTIDKNITLSAPNGATLDGDGIDAEDGVVIEASGVSISGFEILRYSDDGIDIRADDAAISDTTVRLNGGRGIEAVDQAITKVTVRGSEIKNNDFTGIYAEAGGATFILNNTVINDNGDYGIYLDDFETIELNNSRANNNADDAVRAPTDSVLGRTTVIDNFTARLNGDNGLSVSGTADPDSFKLFNSRMSDNSDDGVNVNAEEATVSELQASDNGDGGLVLDSDDPADVTVSDTEVNSNGGSSFDFETGLYIVNGKSVTATNVTADENEHDGVFVGTNAAEDLTVDLTNVSARLNGDEGFDVAGTSGSDSFTISDSLASNNDDNGIYTEIETVDVTATIATDNGDGGLVIDSSSPSDVTVVDADLSENGGTSFDYEVGLFVGASNQINLTEVTVNKNEEDGVTLQAGDTLGVSVEVTHITAQLNGDEGLDVSGTADPDEFSITNGVVKDNADNGIEAEPSTVVLTNMTVDSNGDGGVVLLDGVATATVLNSSFSNNGADDFNFETGLYVEDAATVTIRDSETNENEGSGIQIDAVDVVSRTITIQNVSSRQNTFDGIQINPSANADDIEINGSNLNNNADDGIDTAGSPVTIRTSKIQNNSDIGLVFTEVTESGSFIHESTLVGNGDHAISNSEGAVVNATQNWWGVASGPDENDCDGNVDCTDPLTQPPGTEGPPPVVNDQNPTDPDDDGTFEDVDGSGDFGIIDVQTFFINRDSSVVQNNIASFDFNGDGRVTIIDVQTLFVEFSNQ